MMNLPKSALTYSQARKQNNGQYKLYYVGTKNEIFPGEEFRTAQEAKMYLKVMLFKQYQ